MTETVTVAVYQRLATCPWVRPEAVARGRRRVQTGPLPSGEELARSLLREWALSAWSR
jgi:hypothetical protein